MLDDLDIAVTEVNCLGHCSGPVAVLPVGDRPVVVADIRGKNRRRAVAESLTKSKTSPIRKFALKGKKERKALHRAEKALARR